ncbi:MAG: asparagine synthase (glutamine-hydrolyzing) [Phycisphaeraceae bacterium]|nr:asparagine synthase (glutamine-hydrolyzing) [Phycisphaeraceae bacterium]
MCGIAGIQRTHDPRQGLPSHVESIPEAWLDILDESIKHRGPDGRGRFRQRVARPDGTVIDVALVHRRLAIIDLSAAAAQPMVIGAQTHSAGSGSPARASASDPSLPDLTLGPLIAREDASYQPIRAHVCPRCRELGQGTLAVVFNGCIYNHRDLRKQLQASGHEFFTDHSDTEVLLHGWSEWRNGLTGRIEGMFGLAMWDASEGDVHLARDLFGEKPVYVATLDGESTAFASSAAPLIRLREAGFGRVALSAEPLVEWIAFGYAPSATPVLGIRQLDSGEQVSSNGGCARLCATSLDARTRTRRFTHEFAPLDGGLSRMTGVIEQAIEAAVGKRLESDVPLACFLSGGLDSSLVARAAMRRAGALTTLCVRMPDEAYDESAYARRIAGILGSDHHEIETSPNPAEDLVGLIDELGLPLGDSSLLPTHWVSRAAAERVGVAVGGDGGDELFLGYERYSVAGDLLPVRAVALLTLGLSPHLFARRNPKSASDKVARLLTAAKQRSYRSLLAIHQHPDLRRLLGRASRTCRWDDRANNVRLAQRYDLDRHLPGDLLRKVDTASMSCALEVRSPMLDRDIAELTLRMSSERLRSGRLNAVVSHAQRKGLLRQVARKYFPADIVDRPKQGFAIPIGEWFRTDHGGMRQLLYDHLESVDPFPGLADAGVTLNMGFIRRMLREHDAAGERSINPWHGRDHSQRLYMLLVMSIWSKWLASLRQLV